MTPPLPFDVVSGTVYSVVWPSTERLIVKCLADEAQLMLARHRRAFEKRQDAMHADFFAAWRGFVAPAVKGLDEFGFEYPTAGSSEAIRELIRQAAWTGQALVVFDGEYEGYEAIAAAQGTRIIRVARSSWRQTLAHWARAGVPWSQAGAMWWVSQPSAIDGNAWDEFGDWLDAVNGLVGAQVWVDLCYVGRSRIRSPIDLSAHPCVAGVVFSLSKVMGAYYRRIGGCLAREEVAGLWANKWFKNLDSLYLGQRWLDQAGDAVKEGGRYRQVQEQAIERVLEALGGRNAWLDAGIHWKASDVDLLMHAQPTGVPPASFEELWRLALRGQDKTASARLCLTPTIENMMGVNDVASS